MPCILSVSANKEDFLSLNLRDVDPKECFKRLKGVSAPELSNITPIAPIMKMNKEDKRFTGSYEVINTVSEETNLAAMHWEDFEHLIREIFEKEFAANGGEVKVTRASKDGGVDAVIFDPDPIRGGKIIVQAKRYTNIVGVAAVRDLYGTIVNEGATKGILVTTSDFGSDSIEFAKGKPISLLNGGHLLHLLKKHGYNARINIIEARKLMNENKMNEQKPNTWQD
jgi:restriction system protein